MISLSNIYIRIDIKLSDNEMIEAESNLRNLAKIQSEILFGPNVDVQTHLFEGSLEIIITVAGSLCAAIAGYVPLKNGIIEIIKDSKLLYNIIIGRLYKNGILKEQILKTKKDAGSISKISRLINRIEKIQKSQFRYQKERKEIKNIINYTNRIFNELSGYKDKVLLVKLLQEIDTEGLVYSPSFYDLQLSFDSNDDDLDYICFNRENRKYFDFGLIINKLNRFIPNEYLLSKDTQVNFGINKYLKIYSIENVTKEIPYNKEK